MSTKRNSAIELLRIISMLLIIFHHFSVHGLYKGFIDHQASMGTHLTSALLSSGGKIGVDVFMIISGYFMIHSSFKRKKFNQLLLQMFFYSLLFFGINLFTHWVPIGPKMILTSILPFTYTGYWFVNAYLLIYLFSPFINRLLKSLNKQDFQKFIALIILVVFALPTIFPKSMEMLDNGIIITLSCYIIGAYLRLYPLEFKKCTAKQLGIILTCISFVIIWGSIIVAEVIGNKLQINALLSHTTFFASDSSIFILLLSIGLFLWFSQIKPFYNHGINVIAGTTLGIYLIHDNPLVRIGLWKNILHLDQCYQWQPQQIIFMAIIICPLIFIICSLIEWLRQKIFSVLSR